MTRQQFIDNITEWWELREFCNDENLDDFDDIYSVDEMHDYIVDWVRDYDNWHDMYNYLDQQPWGDDGCYYRKDWDDFTELDDDDFYELKDQVLATMDEYGEWDIDENEYAAVEADANTTFQDAVDRVFAEHIEVQMEEPEISEEEFMGVLCVAC